MLFRSILIKKSKGFQTFNIGDMREIKIKDLIKKIMKTMEINLKIKTKKLQKGSALRRKPNINKIRKLGYMPRTNLENGIKSTVKWYLDN